MVDTALITNVNGCTQKILDGLQDTNTCCSFGYAENHNRPKTNLGRKRKCPKNEKTKTKQARNWKICSFGPENEIRSVSKLDRSTYYPIRTVSITNREPAFVTPEIKGPLRRKNRQIGLKKNRVEEAGALANTISKSIARARSAKLKDRGSQSSTKELWKESTRQ